MNANLKGTLNEHTILPHLQATPFKEFTCLFNLIELLEHQKDFGVHKFTGLDSIVTEAGIETSDVVGDFIRHCYDLQLNIDFEGCETWDEGYRYLQDGCRSIETKDILEVIKLISYAIRSNKQTEGLVGYFKNGSVLQLLKRFKYLLYKDHFKIKYNWQNLSSQQLGRYAEYFVKMEFTKYGFDVYSSEVDDKGIDFLIAKGNKYYEIQCKSLFKSNYVFMQKAKFKIKKNLFLVLVKFKQHEEPMIYLIPSTTWLSCGETSLFVDRKNYAKPEYGLQYSLKNCSLLADFLLEQRLVDLI